MPVNHFFTNAGLDFDRTNAVRVAEMDITAGQTTSLGTEGDTDLAIRKGSESHVVVGAVSTSNTLATVNGELNGLALAGTVRCIGANFWPRTITGTATSLRLLNNTVDQISARLQPGGVVEIFDSVAATVLASSAAGAVTVGQWNHLELVADFVNSSAGFIQVKVEGLVVVSVTGNFSARLSNRFGWQSSSATATGSTAATRPGMNDLYCADEPVLQTGDKFIYVDRVNYSAINAIGANPQGSNVGAGPLYTGASTSTNRRDYQNLQQDRYVWNDFLPNADPIRGLLFHGTLREAATADPNRNIRFTASNATSRTSLINGTADGIILPSHTDPVNPISLSAANALTLDVEDVDNSTPITYLNGIGKMALRAEQYPAAPQFFVRACILG